MYDAPDPKFPPRQHLGAIAAGSVGTGILAALLLAAAPFVPATEAGVTGAILVGLALGWAMLAVLAVRFTDHPQAWAFAPALFLGTGGFLLLAFGSPLHEALAWVWPPALVVLALWMTVQISRRLRSRGARLLLYPGIAVLVLASLGAGSETVRGAVDAQAPPAPGELIDVGGHRLYLNCTGSGSPTVVLEPGAGLKSSDLRWITPVVAANTRVCVYDRAGRGRSEPATTPQDGAHVAADLHTLLERGNEPGPYVLAGHSFGGLYALTFAARYPGEVAGLVLVDSTAPAPAAEQEAEPAQPAAADPDDTMSRVSALVAAAARLGFGRVVGVSDPSHLQSTVEEYLHAGSSVRQAAALRTFTDKPLAVLSAGTGSRPGWIASQEALAALSTNNLHHVVDGSTHASLIFDREDAAATARGILGVVSAVRTGSPMDPGLGTGA
ncbi:alpha/beta fold hydrolase [Arthrobacter crusticola]|uniref:Alpha/beta fold hydrolase n=1 Tax=Arthrobacter crusticola TaxID=2547960 RepID=A0A4R5TPK0_9MICC|nr:alpha/beta hydrolase [Arthrobacter crusticola]TDK24058.1 alpha/beta fold hydrolase [Arthrobacter crusticola]